MKIKLFICIALIFQVVCTNAQNMYGKPDFAIKGGENGKNYAVIVKTNMSKKELVKNTTDFLAKYKLVDPKDVKLDEITESVAEYSLPILIRQTIVACKGFMGATYPDCPIKMHGHIRFEFHENGNVMIVYENFSNEVLAVKSAVDGKRAGAAEEEYYGELDAVMMANTTIGKILIWANVGLENMDQFYKELDNYFNDIDSKFNVYDRMVKEGSAEWLSCAEYVKWRGKFNIPGTNTIVKGLQKYVDEERMLAVAKQRWENNIRPVCDNLFIAISKKLNGEIVGVAEDGDQTWDLVNGTLLPTDSKLQKKYIKAKKSYYDQL